MLVRTGNLVEPTHFTEHMLKLRVVIKHVDGPGMLLQRFLDVSERRPQTGFRKGIKKINQQRIIRNREAGSVRADALERETLLQIALVAGQIFLSDLV